MSATEKPTVRWVQRLATIGRLLALLAAAVIVGYLAGVATPRVKLLLIFWVALGAATGVAVATALPAGTRRQRFALAGCAALLALVVVGYGTWVSYSEWLAEQKMIQQMDDVALTSRLDHALNEAGMQQNPESRQQAYLFKTEMMKERRTLYAEQTTFAAYLQHRLSNSPLRHAPSGTGVVFWILEVFGAALAAGGMSVWRSAPRPVDDPEPSAEEA